jgi:hypothetical protein
VTLTDICKLHLLVEIIAIGSHNHTVKCVSKVESFCMLTLCRSNLGKSLLHGQEGCVFFSGHLNVCKYQYVLVRLGRQVAFKYSTL